MKRFCYKPRLSSKLEQDPDMYVCILSCIVISYYVLLREHYYQTADLSCYGESVHAPPWTLNHRRSESVFNIKYSDADHKSNTIPQQMLFNPVHQLARHQTMRSLCSLISISAIVCDSFYNISKSISFTKAFKNFQIQKIIKQLCTVYRASCELSTTEYINRKLTTEKKITNRHLMLLHLQHICFLGLRKTLKMFFIRKQNTKTIMITNVQQF